MAQPTAAQWIIAYDNARSSLQLVIKNTLKADEVSDRVVVVTILQSILDSALASDATVLAALATRGKYLKNSDGVDRIVVMNGTSYTFTSGKVYWLPYDTLSFVQKKALDGGFNFQLTNQADFIANGINQTFLG